MANPPKPSALKLIQGNPGKRATNKQEPDPAYLNDLRAPVWLPPAAKSIWDEIAPKLRAARLLSEIDVPMLEKACVAIAQYRRAARMVGEDMVIEGAEIGEVDGEVLRKPPQLNQWMVAQSMAFKQAMAVLQHFGMSPADRTRIAIQPQGDLFGGSEKKSGAYFT